MDVALSQSEDSCRCCLKSKNLVPIFDEYINEDIEVAKAIMILIPVPQITRNDGYSQNICIECKHDLQAFYNFREMCITTDENIRSSRRPTSRNNEHDYSTLTDDYGDDMDLSQYLINSTLNHIDPDLKYDAEQLTVEPQIEEQPIPPVPVFDETQNFDASPRYVPKRYACPICHKLWVSPSKLKRHMTVHNKKLSMTKIKQEQTQVQSTIVNKRTQDIENKTKILTELKSAEIKEEPMNEGSCTKFICLLCSIEVPTQVQLQNHMRVQHCMTGSNELDNATKNSLLKKNDSRKYNQEHVVDLQCYECNKSFPNSTKLKRHIKSHDSNRRYKPRPRRHECQHCNKRFETPSKLLRHQSVHRKRNSNDNETTLEISTVTSILGD